MVLTEDPPFLMCGGSLSVHGSAAICPRLFRLLVDQLIGARGANFQPKCREHAKFGHTKNSGRIGF